MEKAASRPQTTKELLIQDSVRRLESKYRQGFASGLLSGRTGLPADWLKPAQIVFVELDIHSPVDPEIQPAALELADRVVHLCDLVYALLDEAALDQAQRASLRRGSGPALVCKVLFQSYATWPTADPRRIGRGVRSKIDKTLRAAVQGKRASPATGGAGPGASASPWPPDDRALAVWERTRATDDPAKLKRYILLDLVEAFVRTAPGLMAAVTLAIVYLGLFLALRHFSPELTTREGMIVAGAAITAALGGSGAVVAGQVIRARLDRGPGRAGPRAGARRTDGAE